MSIAKKVLPSPKLIHTILIENHFALQSTYVQLGNNIQDGCDPALDCKV